MFNDQPTLYIEETPFEELELNYRMAVGLVAAVRDNIRVIVPAHWFKKVTEYGWIKPTADGFTVTDKGHQVLAPRENRAENLMPAVPFVTTPDGQQLVIHMDYLEKQEAQQA